MNLQIRNINYKTFISAYVKEPVLSYELTNKEYQQTKQRGNGEIWAVLSYELTNKEYQHTLGVFHQISVACAFI